MKLIQLVLLFVSVLAIYGFQSVEETVAIQKIRDNASFRLFARFDGRYEFGIREDKPSGNLEGAETNGEHRAIYANMVFTEKQIEPFLSGFLGDDAKIMCVVEIPIHFSRESPTDHDLKKLMKDITSLLGRTGFKEYVIMRHYGAGIVILDQGKL